MRVGAIICSMAILLIVAIVAFVPASTAMAETAQGLPGTMQQGAVLTAFAAGGSGVASATVDVTGGADTSAATVGDVQLPAAGGADLQLAIGWLIASGAGMVFGGWIVHRIRRTW